MMYLGRAARTVQPALRALTAAAVLLLLQACDAIITKPSLYGVVDVTTSLRNGQPVPGASLTLYTGARPVGYAITDAAGHHRFNFVPDGDYGVYTAVPPGYVLLEDVIAGKATAFQDGFSLRGGDTLRPVFTYLKPGVGSISALVTLPNGTPLPNIAVTLYGNVETFGTLTTDAAGRVSFPALPFGAYGVRTTKAAMYLDSGEPDIVANGPLAVDEGSHEQVQFIFAPCFGSVTAVVRDEKSLPVSSARVLLYSPAGVLADTVTDNGGTYTFGNRVCGSYGIHVVPPPGLTSAEGPGATFNDGLQLHRGGALVSTLSLSRIPVASLRVQIRDDAGGPVAGARVVLYTSTAIARDVRTDSNGEALLENILTNAQYGIRVVPPDGYTVEDARGKSFVDGITFVGGMLTTQLFTFTRLR